MRRRRTAQHVQQVQCRNRSVGGEFAEVAWQMARGDEDQRSTTRAERRWESFLWSGARSMRRSGDRGKRTVGRSALSRRTSLTLIRDFQSDSDQALTPAVTNSATTGATTAGSASWS